jgi:hypothetical protein
MLTSLIKYQNNRSISAFQHARKKMTISAFFRKSFFRTILMYLNSVYTNFDISIAKNYFYIYAFITIQVTQAHPSFYFKKLFIK